MYDVKRNGTYRCLREFEKRMHEKDAQIASQSILNKLEIELNLEEQKQEKAKKRKLEKRQRAKLRKNAHKQGMTVQELRQAQEAEAEQRMREAQQRW